CQIDPHTAKFMQTTSQVIRRISAQRARIDARSASFSFSQSLGAEQALLWMLYKDSAEKLWNSTLAQIFQVESRVARRKLVSRFRNSNRSDASIALADRALFDLSDDVRSDAVEALSVRPPQDYQQRLIDGLRYPWPPVAEHAAEALIKIGDSSALVLVNLLVGEPDPALPQLNSDNKWIVRELVRVNHMRNCLLCHASSTSATDLVRGLMPTPGQPLPVVYYEAMRGNFVRADTVYLKQDFSVMHQVS